MPGQGPKNAKGTYGWGTKKDKHFPQYETTYSMGKNSAGVFGIATGRSASAKVDVGYSEGKKIYTNKGEKGRNREPDPKGAPVFKQGGRS